MNWKKSLIPLSMTLAASLSAVLDVNAQMLTISEQEQNLLGIKTSKICPLQHRSFTGK